MTGLSVRRQACQICLETINNLTGLTSTTTQETRRRTQRLANDTWAGPWYEYEYEYDDGRRYTHIDMDETMEGRARQHKQHTHG